MGHGRCLHFLSILATLCSGTILSSHKQAIANIPFYTSRVHLKIIMLIAIGVSNSENSTRPGGEDA